MRAILLTLLILVAYPFVKSDEAEPQRYVIQPPEQVQINDLTPALAPLEFGLHGTGCTGLRDGCTPA